MDKNRILCLSPHTDDAELGCGGSISKWIKAGKTIKHIAFSAADQRVALSKELMNSSKVLGIKKDDVEIFDYNVREFDKYRQDILDDMLEVNKEFKPDLVVIPSTFTTHQDHEIVRDEAFRAFKHASIIGYEDPWNNLTFNTDLFSILSKEDVDNKVKALACYKSQEHRPYMSREFIESLARVRGITIKKEYAEVFEIIRWII